jgi:DNA-binding transcriptional LysR family regulator
MEQRAWLAKLVDPRLDWCLLQAFVDVVECRAFRAASLERRLSLNTLRARIEELERLTGRKLIERSQSGVAVTEAGRHVLRVLDAMTAARAEMVAKLTEKPEF